MRLPHRLAKGLKRMQRTSTFLILVALGTAGDHMAGAADLPGTPAAVTVKVDPESPTAVIQAAIDALGSGGGIVTIPPVSICLGGEARSRGRSLLGRAWYLR
jgi:hypothetical protein